MTCALVMDPMNGLQKDLCIYFVGSSVPYDNIIQVDVPSSITDTPANLCSYMPCSLLEKKLPSYIAIS